FNGFVRFALPSVCTTRSPCSPSYAATYSCPPACARLEWRATSCATSGGSETQSQAIDLESQPAKISAGSRSTSICPAGQERWQLGAGGAGEQTLVAVTHTFPGPMQLWQGGSLTQTPLKQEVPSAHAPPA